MMKNEWQRKPGLKLYAEMEMVEENCTVRMTENQFIVIQTAQVVLVGTYLRICFEI